MTSCDHSIDIINIDTKEVIKDETYKMNYLNLIKSNPLIPLIIICSITAIIFTNLNYNETLGNIDYKYLNILQMNNIIFLSYYINISKIYLYTNVIYFNL